MKRSELFFGFLLIPVDSAMILLAFVLAYFFRTTIDYTPLTADYSLMNYISYAFVYLPFWFMVAAGNGLFKIRNYSGFWQDFYKIIVAVSTSFLIFVAIIFFTKAYFFSRLILALIWVISALTIFAGRSVLQLIQKYLLRYKIGQRNVLVIGENITADLVEAELNRGKYSSYKIIGNLTVDGRHVDSTKKNLGTLDNLAAIVKKNSVDEIILCEEINQKKLIEILQICSDNKIIFKRVPDVINLMTQNFSPSLLGTIPVMELQPIPLDGWGRISKRIFDLVLSILFIIILSPILILISIIVKLSSRGPVLYLHQRVGQNETIFNFYKFRSMYLDQCDFNGGVQWSTKKDEDTRITPIGKILRKTNLDELPQLFNIFKGDMSFVGPRPELPKHVQKFENEIPDYFRRHRVKVGLTGWAQVNGLKGDTSISERVKYDIYYIENWSFWFDIKILIKTFILVLDEAIHGKAEYRTRS